MEIIVTNNTGKILRNIRVCDHYGLTMQQLTGQQPINWALF